MASFSLDTITYAVKETLAIGRPFAEDNKRCKALSSHLRNVLANVASASDVEIDVNATEELQTSAKSLLNAVYEVEQAFKEYAKQNFFKRLLNKTENKQRFDSVNLRLVPAANEFARAVANTPTPSAADHSFPAAAASPANAYASKSGTKSLRRSTVLGRNSRG